MGRGGAAGKLGEVVLCVAIRFIELACERVGLDASVSVSPQMVRKLSVSSVLPFLASNIKFLASNSYSTASFT
jgi:hypothetical protein